MEVKPFPWHEAPNDQHDFFVEFHVPSDPPTEWDAIAKHVNPVPMAEPAQWPLLYSAVIDCGLASFLQSGKGSFNVVRVDVLRPPDHPWQIAFIGDFIESAEEDPWVLEHRTRPIAPGAMILRPWSCVLKQPGNPIEAHWRRYPFQDAKITIVNVEQTDNPKHHKIIPRMIAMLTTTVKHSGRPSGGTAFPEEKIREMLEEIEELVASGKIRNYDRAAAKVFEESNPKTAYAMFNRYRKNFPKK